MFYPLYLTGVKLVPCNKARTQIEDVWKMDADLIYTSSRKISY
jgi:hypothetical protein